ncbi:MAG: helix-turn-helix domain-containing protein [Novosphingobium sp.]
MIEKQSQELQVRVRFFAPPPDLRRYFTTFYYMEFNGDAASPVVDYMHPEWANLRFFSDNAPHAEAIDGSQVLGATYNATGPSSRTVRFTLAPPTRMWGVGLLPLGWAKFIGLDAGDLADAVVDGLAHPAFASFAPLAHNLFGPVPDIDTEYAAIAQHFLDRDPTPLPDEARIIAIHRALIDHEVHTVTDLVEQAGVNQRTLERISHRVFGFSPKLLLRRQRFLRSVAHFVTGPEHRWIESLDSQYHDQSQFVRDFKMFMGMTPRKYAALDKPILGAFMFARAQLAGHPVQGLDPPHGGGKV